MKIKTNFKKMSVLILVTMLLALGCKKSENDNPNIEFKTVNKTITAQGPDSYFGANEDFDINGDGQEDFNFKFGGGSNADTSFYAGASIHGDDVLTYLLELPSDPYNMVTAQAKGNIVKEESTTWTDDAYLSITLETNTNGIAGAGDKYIGFRFIGTDGVHYGWMKVNLSSNYRTLKIIELAYNKIPFAEIRVGDK